MIQSCIVNEYQGHANYRISWLIILGSFVLPCKALQATTGGKVLIIEKSATNVELVV